MAKVYAQGTQTVVLADTYKIAVLSDSPVTLYKQVGYPNHPATWDLLYTTAAGENYISAAMTAITSIRIDASASDVQYDTGTAPVVGALRKQSAATAKADGAESITAAQMINGIVVFTVTTGRTMTTPTGAAILAGCPTDIAAGDSFDFTLITIGAGADDIATLTAGDGDVTFVGSVTVGPSGSTFNDFGTWRFRYTGANAFVGYRVG